MEVPEPGEEVTSGFSWSYSNPIISYMANDVDRGYYTPTGGWKTGTAQSNTQRTGWKNIEGAVPADVGWHIDYYFTNGYMSNDVRVTNMVGSITLNISNLPAGKYVAIFDHWFGSRETTYFPVYSEGKYAMSDIAIQGLQSIKMGTNGLVYGAVRGTEEYLAPGSSYAMGVLGGLHLEQRCEFTVADGDTTKTFTYGDDTFGIPTLCGLRHNGAVMSKYDCFLGSFYGGSLAIRARLYKEA